MDEPLDQIAKNWIKSDLKSLEMQYKIQHQIPEDVTLQYVGDDYQPYHGMQDPKVHFIKYAHLGDNSRELLSGVIDSNMKHLSDKGKSTYDHEVHGKISGHNYDVVADVVTDRLSSADTDDISSIGNSKDFKSNVFNNVHDIKDNDLMLTLKVHTLNGLSDDRMHEIKQGFYDTIKKFKSSFGLESNGKETTFELYLFDSKDQYEHYSKLYK